MTLFVKCQGASIVAKYPNQISIFRKELASDAEHPYTKINNQALDLALRNLDGFKFKLWMYLYRYTQRDKEWDYSPQSVINMAGGSRKSWDTAFNELQNAGYLKPMGNKQFQFYEIPENELETIMSYELKDQEIVWIEPDVVQFKSGEKRRVITF